MAVLPSRERSSDEPQCPEDFIPRAVMHEEARWAHKSILAVLNIFHRSKGFYLDYDGSAYTDNGREFRLKLVPLCPKRRFNFNARGHFVSIHVGARWLQVAVTTQDGTLRLKKEWRYGSKRVDRYRNKPKWRKFGAHVVFKLEQYHRLQLVEGVMES